MARPLKLRLTTTPDYAVDMSPVTPEKLQGKTNEQIKKIKLTSGRQRITVESLFKVTGNDVERIIIENSHKKLCCIGQNLTHGVIEIQGPAGDNVGVGMRGGQIVITGTVGNFAGANMKGGTIDIKGNAGDFVGAGRTGEMQGMAGGLIIVRGNVGDRAGDRMRRGTIFIGKNAGDYCGSRLIAGTIIVMGQTGEYSGYAMKRGTIILTQLPARMTASFQDCGEFELGYLRLLFKQFAQMGQPLSKLNQFSPRAKRFAGDLANQGLGEILLLQ